MPKTPQNSIYIRRIGNRLDELFKGLIDLSDWEQHEDEKQREVFLHRALAAYVLICEVGIDPITASQSVTDGGDDKGIDAIFIDRSTKLVYLVQSKWSDSSAKSLSQADALKFINGVRRVLHDEWDGFNQKVLALKEQLQEVICDPTMKCVCIVVSPSQLLIPTDTQSEIDKSLAEFNTLPDQPLVSFEPYNLSRLHRSLLEIAGSSPIDLQITLLEWGVIRHPHTAYYGQIEVGDILDWKKHGNTLFDKNLRNFQGQRTDVFNSISETLVTEPKNFWYFNNGATLICSTIRKAPIYADKREKGIFECKAVSVVNGAQTIGSVWHAGRDGAGLDPDTRMPIRIISLEKCEDDFAVHLTRAANTQNRIGNRDFAALDPNQLRLASEMSLEGRKYVFRSGDHIPHNMEGCDMAEAAACLASALSLDLTVRAKRELGSLWSDIKKEPYTLIFNDNLTVDYLWRVVTVARSVEDCLNNPANIGGIFRGRLIGTHGNRMILFRVFADPDVKRSMQRDLSDLCRVANDVALRELHRISAYIRNTDPNGYPQMFFKNFEKCKILNAALNDGFDTPVQNPVVGISGELFDGIED